MVNNNSGTVITASEVKFEAIPAQSEELINTWKVLPIGNINGYQLEQVLKDFGTRKGEHYHTVVIREDGDFNLSTLANPSGMTMAFNCRIHIIDGTPAGLLFETGLQTQSDIASLNHSNILSDFLATLIAVAKQCGFMQDTDTPIPPVAEDGSKVNWRAETLREVLKAKWLVIIPEQGIVEFKGRTIHGFVEVEGCYTPPQQIQPALGLLR